MEIELICDYCGKNFKLSKTLYNKRLKRNKNFYCSRECSYKNRENKIEIECFSCGRKFYTNPHRLKQSKSGRKFCSKSCSNSYNNTLRKKESLNTYRRIAFEEYEHKCKICGWKEDERILEVHHIDENRKNNKLNNLIILCPTCHKYLTLHLKSLEQLIQEYKK